MKYVSEEKGHTSASSTYQEHKPAYMENDQDANYWQAQENENEWLMFQFPRKVKINVFKTRTPQGAQPFRNYNFQLHNGTNWTIIYEGERNAECCFWEHIDLPPAEGDTFRLLLKNTWGYGKISIQELKLSFEKGCGNLN